MRFFRVGFLLVILNVAYAAVLEALTPERVQELLDIPLYYQYIQSIVQGEAPEVIEGRMNSIANFVTDTLAADPNNKMLNSLSLMTQKIAMDVIEGVAVVPDRDALFEHCAQVLLQVKTKVNDRIRLLDPEYSESYKELLALHCLKNTYNSECYPIPRVLSQNLHLPSPKPSAIKSLSSFVLTPLWRYDINQVDEEELIRILNLSVELKVRTPFWKSQMFMCYQSRDHRDLKATTLEYLRGESNNVDFENTLKDHSTTAENSIRNPILDNNAFDNVTIYISLLYEAYQEIEASLDRRNRKALLGKIRGIARRLINEIDDSFSVDIPENVIFLDDNAAVHVEAICVRLTGTPLCARNANPLLEKFCLSTPLTPEFSANMALIMGYLENFLNNKGASVDEDERRYFQYYFNLLQRATAISDEDRNPAEEDPYTLLNRVDGRTNEFIDIFNSPEEIVSDDPYTLFSLQDDGTFKYMDIISHSEEEQVVSEESITRAPRFVSEKKRDIVKPIAPVTEQEEKNPPKGEIIHDGTSIDNKYSNSSSRVMSFTTLSILPIIAAIILF